MARPLVSVASVRVSLTVMTKQRTERGACALWTRSDIFDRSGPAPRPSPLALIGSRRLLRRLAPIVALTACYHPDESDEIFVPSRLRGGMLCDSRRTTCQDRKSTRLNSSHPSLSRM